MIFIWTLLQIWPVQCEFPDLKAKLMNDLDIYKEKAESIAASQGKTVEVGGEEEFLSVIAAEPMGWSHGKLNNAASKHIWGLHDSFLMNVSTYYSWSQDIVGVMIGYLFWD